MPSVTVGSGGTYADWAAFATAINAASPLAADWDVLQISSFTQVANAIMSVALNGHNLTIG